MKKIKLYALAVFLLIGIPISVAFAFNDTSGSRNEPAINYLYEKGVIEGYDDGSYKPNYKINRAEFTKILIESKYPGGATGSDCFLDVEGDWYAKYVCYAKQLNIVDGYDDGTFGPANYINLAEALKIVLETYDIQLTQSSESWAWYVTYERTAEDLDLFNYIYSDIDDEINRGEMAQLVYNVEMYLEGENGDDVGDDTNDDGLTFDENTNATFIPNVAILEFDGDDECRYSNGNVRGDCVVEKFYENHDDDYDVIMVIDAGDYEGKYNGESGFNVRRYMPTNVGKVEDCDDTCQEEYPERLRYRQQIGDSWKDSADSIFIHELGHTWGVGWITGSDSIYETCYEDEPWVEYAFENGHWTELFQAGRSGVMAYIMNSVSEGEKTGIPQGILTDNHDGTFTHSFEADPATTRESLTFNYMDLYAMGLMSEEELATKEIYVVMDPIEIGEDLYSGTRYDLTLDDFKNLLLKKEECEGTGSNYYYTGDGSRQLDEYDNGKELAEDFNVAIVLIKYPEQEISMEDAYTICERVNYDWPNSWSIATYGLSTVNMNLTGEDPSPDCAELYSE
ncbi:MAG: S-layer homology domain-containing protein [Candidatus Gracilibacteria bacterium]